MTDSPDIPGVDYAWARPGGAALQAAGKHFAIRYVPYDGDGGKGLGLAEVADLRAHGLSIGLVWETTAGRALAGYAAGVNDAQYTLGAIAKFNFGSSIPIYFAVDFDATASQLLTIDSYLRGAATVLGSGRVGVYGSYNVVSHCRQYGTARYLWQTYAWSYGALLSSAHLYQYQNTVYIGGQEVDLTRALQADYGQWPRPSVIPNTGTGTTGPTAGGLPVSFVYRAGWKATIIAGKPRRAAAGLAAKNYGTTSKDTAFLIWGEVKGDSVGGSTRWFFGPQYIGAWRVAYIPLIDTKNRVGF
jgi:hypothetical protein